jgi:hypothetical protein
MPKATTFPQNSLPFPPRQLKIQGLPYLCSMSLQKNYSLWAFLLVALGMLLSQNSYDRTRQLIIEGGDAWGYYLYLPATFIHHDLDSLHRSLQTRGLYGPGARKSRRNPLGIDEAWHLGEGRQVIKYTAGIALLNAPFFGLAHLWASNSSQHAADGFSLPYRQAIAWASLLYALLGLWVLRLLLLRFFRQEATALSLLGIGLASNLYFFAVHHMGMAHAYQFALYAFLLYATHRYYQDFRWRHLLLIALSAGFITLVRPVEMICVLIPLLYGVGNRNDMKARWGIWGQHRKQLLVAAGIFVLVGVPQLIYWKWATGSWLHYSYGHEGFHWGNPQLSRGLFGFKNGWLVYTPIMVLALLGFFARFRQHPLFLPLILLLPLHIYITYSWWNWQYINGFGSRPMVDIYALLAFPLAAAFAWLLRSWVGWATALIALGFFSWLNLLQSYQTSRYLLIPEDGNRAYYQAIFGKNYLTYEAIVAFDSEESQPDSSQLHKVRVIHHDRLADSLDVNFDRVVGRQDTFAYSLTREKEYGPGYQVTISELPAQAHDWLRISVVAYKEETSFGFYEMSQVIAAFGREGKNLKWKQLRIDNKLGNHYHYLYAGRGGIWQEVHFWTQVPAGLRGDDTFSTYLRNPSPWPIWIDELKVEVWR